MAYKKWTDEETDLAVRLRRQGMTTRDVGLVLERTPGSVREHTRGAVVDRRSTWLPGKWYLLLSHGVTVDRIAESYRQHPGAVRKRVKDFASTMALPLSTVGLS